MTELTCYNGNVEACVTCLDEVATLKDEVKRLRTENEMLRMTMFNASKDALRAHTRITDELEANRD